MISALAKGDYEDMIADGLQPTLEDFDRLNLLALRLTDGAETTAANFPRIGWAGDVPFHQPTCAAFAWYLNYADRGDFDVAMKNACWFYALNHGRIRGAFDALVTPDAIKAAVNDWLSALPVAHDEIQRACRYAVTGFDDATAAKTDAEKAADAKKSTDDLREESLSRIDNDLTVTAALTGIPPDALATETQSRLKRMVDEVRANAPMGGGICDNHRRQRDDYDLTFREIRKRLAAEKAKKEAEGNGK